MYDSSDPRSTLSGSSATATATAPPPDHFSGPDLGRFYAESPVDADAAASTWLVRGQSVVVAYTDAQAGAVLSRPDQVDEYAVLLPERGAGARITAGADTRDVDGDSLAFVPPGASSVEMTGAGPVVRVFTTRSTDLTERCPNRDAYAEPRTTIPPPVDWPTPADGLRIRAYDLDVAPEPGRFGRIWRCTTLMINVLDPQDGPRDVTKLSPHHHDDFEQCSLALEGTFMHHLRWPWVPDMTVWRDDEHIEVQTPSVLIIPPPAIHTSRATGEGVNRLVDIFAPPRRDFSERPGWVLNADDYPMP